MGQQQLLLLILSAIIVGLSIVAGVEMFGNSAASANQDAVTQEVLTIASRAQGWYRRPAQMGGGGRSFSGVTLGKLNFPDSTSSGKYALSGIAAGEVTITGDGTEDGDDDGTAIKVTVKVFPDSVGTATITL